MEAFLALIIPAIVKLVETLNKKDWESAGKIVLSAVVGLVAGLLGIGGFDALTGLQSGLAVSGAITVVSYVGKKKQ